MTQPFLSPPVLLLSVVFIFLHLHLCLHPIAASSDSHHHKSFPDYPHQKVNVSSIPGIRFSPHHLDYEQHYTGYLPTQPLDSSSTSSSSLVPPPRLFYYLVKKRRPSDSHPSDTTPLTLWFNGGPGCASTVALLQENGPFTLQHSKFTQHPSSSSRTSPTDPTLPFQLVWNPYSWSEFSHMLYIDQPVGVGFSSMFPHLSPSSIPASQGDIARSLHIALTHFLEHQHPELQHSPISLSGESYAAKYIPSFASYILGQNRCKALHKHRSIPTERNEDSDEEEAEAKESEKGRGSSVDRREREERHIHRYFATFRSLNLTMKCDPSTDHSAPPIPLRSLLIGNGVYSPLLQRFAFRPLALSLGLIDVKQANQYAALESHCLGLLRKAVIVETSPHLLVEAEHACGRMHSLIVAMSGGVDTSDLRRYTDVFNKTLFVDFLNHPLTRKAWHVPSLYPTLKSDCNSEVHERLRADTMRGVRGLLPFLLYSLPITVYTGNLDMKDGTWANEVLLDSLWDWDDRAQWFLSRRYVWRPLSSLSSNSLYLNRTNNFLQNHTSNMWLSSGSESVYGYSKAYGNLSFVTVSQAGHMVASSQPEKAADLFYRFIHRLPYYNDDDEEDRERNAVDAHKVGDLLRCDEDKHGHWVEKTALCSCDENWTGATCTIPVHHLTSHLFPEPPQSSSHTAHSHSDSSPSSSPPLLSTPTTRYSHRDVLSPQDSSLYYLLVTADGVELFGIDPDIHDTFSSHQTVDNVQSSCTFSPPLLLHIRLQEKAAAESPSGRPLSKEERNMGLTSDGHLSVSLLWTSRFHVSNPSNATAFMGSFDSSNTFFSSGGATAAQSIAPVQLAYHSSPSVLHTLSVWINRCDHYAIRVFNTQGALHDIAYHLTLSLTGDPHYWEQEKEDEGGRTRARHGSTGMEDGFRSDLRHHHNTTPQHHHSHSFLHTFITALPWVLCMGLGALVAVLLWRLHNERQGGNLEERRPLLL